MPATYKIIANQKISGGSAPTTITFSGIPQTFSDLVIHLSHKASGATDYALLRYQLNGSSSSQYSNTGSRAAGGNFSATTDNNQANMNCAYSIGGNAGATNGMGSMQIYIPQYTNATQVKVGYVTSNASSYSSTYWASAWVYQNVNNSSIGGITSISFNYANGWSFADDTQITLYGVSNS